MKYVGLCFVFLASAFLSTCSDDSDEFMVAKINGQSWAAKIDDCSKYSFEKLVVTGYPEGKPDPGKYYISLTDTSLADDNPVDNLSSGNLIFLGTYGEVYLLTDTVPAWYVSTSGKIEITHLDSDFVSGKFSYVASSISFGNLDSTDIVKVTNGRFRLNGCFGCFKYFCYNKSISVGKSL